MSKSIKGASEAQSVQILAAALALGMSLGMVGATAADAADSPTHTIKGESADHKVTNEEYLKLHGGSTHKVGGQDTDKVASTIKLQGQTTHKVTQTIKLDGATHKVDGQTTHKTDGN